MLFETVFHCFWFHQFNLHPHHISIASLVVHFVPFGEVVKTVRAQVARTEVIQLGNQLGPLDLVEDCWAL